MSLFRASMWALALSFVVAAAVFWSEVPARIPTHFGAAGQPDAWGPRSVATWFALPVVALAVAVLIEWAARQSLHRPESGFVNISRKAETLALPPTSRSEALGWLGVGLYLGGAAVVVALAMVQVGVWVTARGGSGAAWVNVAVGVAVVIPLGAVLWASRRSQAVVNRELSSQPAR